ncbi:MAG: DUF3368 domain-containing protein [Leptolyngbyaceae cyanobacterium RU_5_1]|nr:DUF3368 domain-containing protein [Leptolyngbyaceae cyanobacterium RU_5_1]
MPEVISDTSPIQYLYQTNLLDLLTTLYGQIILPQAVIDELAEGRNLGVALPDPASLSWVTVRQAQDFFPIDSVIENLGAGERETLALALEIPGSLVLLDDALARSYARSLEVRFTGTLGVLLKAKQSGYLTAVMPILDQLDNLGFRLDLSTRATVLRLAEESL